MYQNGVNWTRYAMWNPIKRTWREMIPDDAIVEAVVFDAFGGRRKVYYLDTLTCMYHLFLMWFVFGKDAWMDVYRREMFTYKIDGATKDDGEVLYVRLANGHEYLTHDDFDAHDLSAFEAPTKRYLCVMLSSLNITRFYKRFASSWNNLKLRVIDIALLGIKLDSSIRHYLNHYDYAAGSTTLTLVDDETFEEKLFNSGDLAHFA